MKKIITFLSLFLLIPSFGTAQETKKILDEYLIITAENNPGLKAKFSEYMAAMEKVPQVGTLPDPNFAFGYFINPVETRLGPQKASFGLNQAFPWFGTLGAKRDAASEAAKAKYEVFENSKSNLFFTLKTMYYNYYYTHKAIQITKENIEILRIFKNLSLVKIEAGNATIVDELRVELELNDLENQLALFIDTKNSLRIGLNSIMNRALNSSVDVPEILNVEQLPYPKDILLDSIYSNNHEIKTIEHKLNSFMNQEIAAKKVGAPKFNIGINYIIVGKNPNSSDPNNGKDALLFPSIGVSIPIYRNKYKGLIKEAQYLQESEQANKSNKKNTLGYLYGDTVKDFDDSDRRIQLNQNQSVIAKKVLDVLIISYSTNSKDFEEVLRIERQLLGYKLAEQKAISDKNAAVAFINYLLGN
ncbi:MAG: TolC family protein [Flavobacteriaceae bacterium]|nr:TolC family protein [Flavobacteriaceae bacterium]